MGLYFLVFKQVNFLNILFLKKCHTLYKTVISILIRPVFFYVKVYEVSRYTSVVGGKKKNNCNCNFILALESYTLLNFMWNFMLIQSVHLVNFKINGSVVKI